jgi:membrane protein
MGILRSTLKAFMDDDCPRMAAAMSYYTVFSLPGLLVLVMLIAGAFADPAQIRGRILMQMQTLIGPGAAEQVREILVNASRPGAGGPLTIGLSVGAILFAATGAFAQLQTTLNRAWEVEPDPERGSVRNFLTKRVLSFGMILAVSLLLLVSMLAQTFLASFDAFVSAALPEPFSAVVLHAISVGLSLVVGTLLFGVIFEVVPDADVEWRDAWIAAGVTAVLFVLGNYLLGLYVSRGGVGSAFGAAGSLAVLLVWIYYSAMILFLGAELTQVLARHRGSRIQPSRGAVRIVLERRIVRPGETD